MLRVQATSFPEVSHLGNGPQSQQNQVPVSSSLCSSHDRTWPLDECYKSRSISAHLQTAFIFPPLFPSGFGSCPSSHLKLCGLSELMLMQSLCRWCTPTPGVALPWPRGTAPALQVLIHEHRYLDISLTVVLCFVRELSAGISTRA